jgi:hypothetical protein
LVPDKIIENQSNLAKIDSLDESPTVMVVEKRKKKKKKKRGAY